MKPSFLESVLRGAEALAARDPVGLLPDKELLKRFTADRDPSAFAVLVRRHGPLVWGVCRNLLLEDGEAEDAFQATFLALVKSASSVNRPEALGGWLHGVAYRVAMKARRSAARRKKRESVAACSEEDNPVADGAWDELQAAVHEEVCRLPEKLRLPFVLVGLQGRPQKEAAKQLGWTVGTFSARLCQARQRLLERLSKRNMPVGVAASATALGVASGSAAVPTALVLKALNVVSAPDAVTPFVISLTWSDQMYLTRTKLLVAGVMLVGILTTGIGARLMSNAEAQTPEVIADVERKLEALREQQAKGKWEYKFVPMETVLPAKELQRVLASHDREGWEYCGSQDVATKGQPVPHLTFKRLNKAFTPTTEREQLLLEALKTYEEALKLDPKNKGVKQTTPEELKEYYQRAIQAQYDAALKLKSVEAQKAEAIARQRAEAELRRAMEAEDRARVQQAEAVAEKLKAEAERVKAFGERDRAAQLQKQLEDLKAEHAALLKQIEAQKKAGGGEKKPESEILTFHLKHVDAMKAAEVLQKVVAEWSDDGKTFDSVTGKQMDKSFRIAVDHRTNALIVQGPADKLAGVKTLIASKIDLAPSASDKPVIALLHLRNLNQKEAISVLSKAMPKIEIIATPRNDQLSIKGTQVDIDTATAVVAKLMENTVAEATIALKNLTLEQATEAVFKSMPSSKLKLGVDAKRVIMLSGPPEDVAKAKKIVEELDAAAVVKPSK